MKVEMDIRGPKKPPAKANGEFWDFTMNYYGLPEEYVDEIVNLATSYAAFITNTPGTATEEPKYTVDLKVTGPEVKGNVHGMQRDLKYSEMKAMQDAGIELLKKLQGSAEVEIRAGQRK